ncbi:hypothetical protein THAOC_20014 [Thalassiosira oceanica]|uniref:Uncharacterized protein n=1 Tax=Thalassiosira oceanica TaxID=159749 RepID=K0SFQ2_THAOC|nr:hypothetical protein THAOC_20014 [Thalassiosira oceanica]|eukprot:EJK59726.1 hypothetical protein THAOC_20014 [Thalassiosira oceanica]
MYPFLFCALAHTTSAARKANNRGATWFLMMRSRTFLLFSSSPGKPWAHNRCQLQGGKLIAKLTTWCANSSVPQLCPNNAATSVAGSVSHQSSNSWMGRPTRQAGSRRQHDVASSIRVYLLGLVLLTLWSGWRWSVKPSASAYYKTPLPRRLLFCSSVLLAVLPFRIRPPSPFLLRPARRRSAARPARQKTRQGRGSGQVIEGEAPRSTKPDA